MIPYQGDHSILKKNSRTIQEHFKDIKMFFKNQKKIRKAMFNMIINFGALIQSILTITIKHVIKKN